MVSVGRSTPDGPKSLRSEVVPLSFRLVPGVDRPTIQVSPLDGGPARLI